MHLMIRMRLKRRRRRRHRRRLSLARLIYFDTWNLVFVNTQKLRARAHAQMESLVSVNYN